MRSTAFASRSNEQERMDLEPLPPEELGRCLRDLERLTAIGLAHRPTLAWLARIARGRRHISVLDVGSGGGDLLRRIAVWTRREGIAARLEGVDLNPSAAFAASRATDPAIGILWRTSDVFDLPDDGWDVIVSAHFAHHLDDAGVARFLSWMNARARLGWHVNDLHRHRVLHAALRALGPALRLHPFVVSDGPVSVRRAFVRADWERAIAAAGLERSRLELRRHVPFRWGVGVRPDALVHD
jgi:SAM-dependent methyltransferase